MDSSRYKTIIVSRGLKYNYYAVPAQPGKPTLFLCHGFPSTANDWRYFVAYFQPRGYGLIVPDMLGFGGTDKPTDPAAYLPSKISKDLVDILGAEKIDKVIAIGHDWGSKAISRLASYYPERFSAYIFLAVPYLAPRIGMAFEDWLAQTTKQFGSELYGYWLFFSEDDVDKTIRSHIDSFASILFPHDPAIWKTRMAPVGAMKQSLLEGFTARRPSWMSEEDYETWKKTFLENGFEAPTCWYKIYTNNTQEEDDKLIPPERAYPPVQAPIYFGAALQDYICTAAAGHYLMENDAFKDHDITIRDFDADHWLVFSKADEICRDLESWIEEKASPKYASQS